MNATVLVFVPFVMSFFTHRSFPVSRKCHTQLFYRPDLSALLTPATFSCDGPIAAPLQEVFPFYVELSDFERGVFSNKVKIFFAEKSMENNFSKIYFKVNSTSMLLHSTENASEASVFTIVTKANSEIHSPGGRFHFEYQQPAAGNGNANMASKCTSSSEDIQLCAKYAPSNTQNRCGPHNLVIANCSASGLQIITGLLAPYYTYPAMNQCNTFTL